MQSYPHIETDLLADVNYIHQRTEIIQKLKNTFLSFGYKEVYIPTFQPYDLYMNMNGTVNQQEMMKTIDYNGNVLVLRPDVTIPLTQQIALSQPKTQQHLRYFYILEIFRQAFEAKGSRENTQAGVEYLGNATPEADAEVIALSIQVLAEMGIQEAKIELGHADFFKQLTKALKLDHTQLQELRKLIQTKNVPEIEFFMKTLDIPKDLKEIVLQLPFLYGAPQKVFEKVNQLKLTEAMRQSVTALEAIYDNLVAYQVDQHIVLDLSLINHMDYYSDLIFQGFIEQVGKPVLMGGRYDRLADEFDANIPAIGFAFDLQLLLETFANQTKVEASIDVCLYYPKAAMENCINIAHTLREAGLQVVLYPDDTAKEHAPYAKYLVEYTADELLVNQTAYKTAEHLLTYLKKARDTSWHK